MAKISFFWDLFKKKKSLETGLVDYMFNYANSLKCCSKGYVASYKNIARKLEKFQTVNHCNLMTDGLNEAVSEEFVYFLKKEDLRPATIKGLVARLVRVLKSAEKKGLGVDYSIEDIPIVGEEPFTVYLSQTELNKILELRLKKEADLVRDVFLIGCYTGLRYSDLIRISEDNFIEGIIKITSLKTRITSAIPIHPVILPILEKYNYSFPLPKTPQNYNQVLKRICKRAGITEMILLEYTKGTKIVRKKVPKYSLISSHTARRSLATNMYLTGEPVFRIMLITGHKTEESFFGYIRISRSENAKELKKGGFFTGESLNLSQNECNDTGSNNKGT